MSETQFTEEDFKDYIKSLLHNPITEQDTELIKFFTGRKPYRCPYCKSWFEYLLDFTAHITIKCNIALRRIYKTPVNQKLLKQQSAYKIKPPGIIYLNS